MTATEFDPAEANRTRSRLPQVLADLTDSDDCSPDHRQPFVPNPPL